MRPGPDRGFLWKAACCSSFLLAFSSTVFLEYAQADQPDTQAGLSHRSADDGSFESESNDIRHFNGNVLWCCGGGTRLTHRISVGRLVYFGIEGGDLPAGHLPPQTCSWYGHQFVFDGTTESGKNMLSLLLAAKLANKSVALTYIPSSAPGTDESSGCGEKTMARPTLIDIAG